ncbi:hypothetical protein B0H10DRAFT_665004 [Mycena sp. CBHHK59/15]|nr:hypothetical protein B0H10DRAFT_665004 [Mycena sp. CBHHK59/15]
MTGDPDVYADIAETLRTNYVGFASFTILIWDHVDTFASEVEYIWNRRKGIIVYLFLLNRYLTPLGFVVNLFAYLSPVWTEELPTFYSIRRGHDAHRNPCSCNNDVTPVPLQSFGWPGRFEPFSPQHQGPIFDKRIVIGGVFSLFMVMFTMNAWLLTRGEPVTHNPESGVHACTMIFPPNISVIAASSAWMPLLYDSVVLILILMKTLPSIRNRNTSFMMKRLLEDGLIYYTAIFSVTLVLTIMIISAPPGLKNIAAQLELLITVTMMSRITLNLKRCARKALENTIILDAGPIVFRSGSQLPSNAGAVETEIYRHPMAW